MWRRRLTESAWRLRADLTTAKVLIWAASVGRDASLTPETHFYLANRYDRLSHIYRVRGPHAKVSHRVSMRCSLSAEQTVWSTPL